MSVIAATSNSPLADVLQRIDALDLPDLEQALRATASRLARRKLADSPSRETDLLEKINLAALPIADRSRYRFLYKKLESESILDSEHVELTALIERQEQQNIIRLRALVELSALRQISLEELMQQMGIKKLAENG